MALSSFRAWRWEVEGFDLGLWLFIWLWCLWWWNVEANADNGLWVSEGFLEAGFVLLGVVPVFVDGFEHLREREAEVVHEALGDVDEALVDGIAVCEVGEVLEGDLGAGEAELVAAFVGLVPVVGEPEDGIGEGGGLDGLNVGVERLGIGKLDESGEVGGDDA